MEESYPCILGLVLLLRVEIRVRVTLRFLLPNHSTKLCIRVISKSNSGLRARVKG